MTYYGCPNTHMSPVSIKIYLLVDNIGNISLLIKFVIHKLSADVA